MVEPIFDYQFRVIIIGDSTVGKSCLLRQFTEGTFDIEVSDPTVGVDFFARLVEANDGTKIKLQLWDTAGQERFKSITQSYYRNSVGALLVYDISNRESFNNIPQWLSEVHQYISNIEPTIMLIGAKADLLDSREVPFIEAQATASFHQIMFSETSAKTGDNVEETFQEFTEKIYNRLKTGHYRLQDGWDGIKTGYSQPVDEFICRRGQPVKSCCF